MGLRAEAWVLVALCVGAWGVLILQEHVVIQTPPENGCR
jgi:hypothetical protein